MGINADCLGLCDKKVHIHMSSFEHYGVMTASNLKQEVRITEKISK